MTSEQYRKEFWKHFDTQMHQIYAGTFVIPKNFQEKYSKLKNGNGNVHVFSSCNNQFHIKTLGGKS